jgi:hypothetical protein
MVKRKTEIPSKNCVICKKEFYIRDNQKPYQFKKQKCCSRSCNAKLSASYCIGKKAHNNQQEERICIWCGKKEMVSPSFSKRPYCSRSCMQKHYASGILKGENHWNWQGGITEDEGRESLYPGYKEWRREVYKRDNFTCVICGCNDSGSLQAHHIKDVANHKDLILDVDNGITLCEKCHKELHYGKNKS